MVRCTIYARISILVQQAINFLMSPHWWTKIVQCTIFAQISGLWIKDSGIFTFPQWESNSKAFGGFVRLNENMFQSPQWGSNSKGVLRMSRNLSIFQFQSPQWGSNSKGEDFRIRIAHDKNVSVPAMGKQF